MLNPLKIYILSPHIDDAAFGLTHTIGKFISNKIPVTVINCFTVTKWTAIPVANKEIATVSQLRKDEDAAFYKTFGGDINIINLDLLDAPLRNGYIYQDQPFQQNELELISNLQKLLQQHVDALLLCPLAIGNHIDHAICREAVTGLYKKIQVTFFEDLPYARRIGENKIHLHIQNLEKQLSVHLTNNTFRANNCKINKEENIRMYKSQINEEIISEIIAHRDALGGERLWGEQKNIDALKTFLDN